MQGRKTQKKRTRRPLRALILAPTRELALQVSAHLNQCLNGVYRSDEKVKVEDEEEGVVPEEGTGKDVKGGKSKGGGGKKDKSKNEKTEQKQKAKAPPLVSVAAIVGGMSAQKQKRVLERGVDVLVATPGRLWDVVEEVSLGFRSPLPMPFKQQKTGPNTRRRYQTPPFPRARRSGQDDRDGPFQGA